MSTTEQNKAIYRRFIDVAFNEGRLDRLNELITPDYVFHDAPPGTPAGAEGIGRLSRSSARRSRI